MIITCIIIILFIIILGNNLYKDDIKTTLSRIQSSNEREQYILMELIRAPSFPNLILMKNETTPFEANVVAELGIYGTFVRYAVLWW